MFVGTFNHNIDAKGRVFIPAKLRQELGQRFYICRGLECRCIRAYSEAEWHKMLTKLRDNTAGDNIARRRVSASSIDVEMDSQGRIMITELLRNYAGLTDKVCIVGMLDWVEFWDPAQYAAIMGDEFGEPSEAEYKALVEAGIS